MNSLACCYFFSKILLTTSLQSFQLNQYETLVLQLRKKTDWQFFFLFLCLTMNDFLVVWFPRLYISVIRKIVKITCILWNFLIFLYSYFFKSVFCFINIVFYFCIVFLLWVLLMNEILAQILLNEFKFFFAYYMCVKNIYF